MFVIAITRNPPTRMSPSLYLEEGMLVPDLRDEDEICENQMDLVLGDVALHHARLPVLSDLLPADKPKDLHSLPQQGKVLFGRNGFLR